ncbi:Fur family transcriptional regulator [Nocardioides mesophilus]|uniref:Transcriptional repressor n=1 Tax=Nocardioides mesophilus TaxID=433659 RepID=A0A7G9REJ0_9ACTN|nr:Fur family transcriptional regulator [Nocardioides mesophilus]QNN54015.1 transcriptional repressor [Nocardioides mesophilus]
MPAEPPASPEHPAVPATDDWQAQLRAKGYRLTPQRELVLAAVQRLGHATPDEVLAAAREESPAVNLSTVYRTLELLEELGLVRHAHLTDRAPTYHSTTAPTHAHLVCRDCGRVGELPARDLDPLTELLRRDHGFEPDLGHLTIFGTCRDCLGATGPG